MTKRILKLCGAATLTILLCVCVSAAEYGDWLLLDAPEAVQDYNVFQEHYYYEADKLERYLAFHAENPSLPIGDVVWMVNAMLDRPFYNEVREIDDFSIFPLLVNKYNRLPDDYVPEDLTELPSGRKVTSAAWYAFMEMTADAYSQGFRIRDVSAFRSFSTQTSLYYGYLSSDTQKSVDTYSARAGFSEHQTGLAIDLCGSNGVMNRFGYTKESQWIEENGYIYGFIVRYPKGMSHITGYISEPWHITYVGSEIASSMKETGITTLEEYMVKYIQHTPNQ